MSRQSALRSAKTGPPGAGLPEPPADCRLPAEHGQCQHCSGHPRPDRCFRSRFTHRRRHPVSVHRPDHRRDQWPRRYATGGRRQEHHCGRHL